jgi:hypothetical protein
MIDVVNRLESPRLHPPVIPRIRPESNWRGGASGLYFFGLAQLQYRCVSRALAGIVFPPNQYISM